MAPQEFRSIADWLELSDVLDDEGEAERPAEPSKKR
jgi:hypothetical protein